MKCLTESTFNTNTQWNLVSYLKKKENAASYFRPGLDKTLDVTLFVRKQDINCRSFISLKDKVADEDHTRQTEEKISKG